MEPESNRTKCELCPAFQRSMFCEAYESLPIKEWNKTYVEFEAGQSIPLNVTGREGFYCIKSGGIKLELQVFDSVSSVKICGPGEIVGFGEWFGSGRKIATAISHVKACFIPRKDFVALLKQSNPLSQSLIKRLIQTIEKSEEEVARLGRFSVRGRVAAIISELANKFGVAEDGGVKIDLRVDRKTLSQLSGTVSESFARVLTDLEQDKILERRGRMFLILDPARLSEAARQ